MKDYGKNYQPIIESHIKNINCAIDENNSSSSNTFKKHLLEIAKKDYFKRLDFLIKSYGDRGGVPENFENSTRFNAFAEFVRRKSERISKQYSEHKQLFKNAFNAEEERFHFRPLEVKDLEKMEDGILKIIHNNKVKKYANSFLRSYKNLMNEESYNLFDSIMDKELDRKFVQNEIRKVATFKDSNYLNRVLKKIVQSEHTVDYILSKIESNNLNVDKIFQSEDALVIEVKDFETSEIIGSNQWCISTDKFHFEEYLFKHNNELPENIDTSEETIVKGHQIFVFDFAKSSGDPFFMVGITVGSNGSIVAAHDKNDNDIFKKIKQSVCENSYQIINEKVTFSKGNDLFSFDLEKVITDIDYNQSESKKEILSEYRHQPEIFFEQDGIIFYNTINPLNAFISIYEDCSKAGDFNLESFENLFFNSAIVNKSISDYYRFKNIDAKTMVEDLLKAYILVHKLNEHERNHGIDNNEYNSRNDLEKEFDINIKAEKILQNKAVNIIFNDLNDLEKTIIFKDNKNLMMNVLDVYTNDLEFINHFPSLANSSETIPMSFKSALSAFSFHLIDHIDGLEEKTDSVKKIRDILVFEHVINNPDPKKEIINDFIDLIKKGKLHSNKVFANIEQFSNKFKKVFAKEINKKSEYIESITNKVLQPLSFDDIFISNLNEKSCKKMNESIKKNKINFGVLNDEARFFKSGKFSFSERMKKLKDKKIIDDEIISRHYDDSRVAFGNKKNTHLFLPKKEQKSLIKNGNSIS
jgi:hypothetical protein